MILHGVFEDKEVPDKASDGVRGLVEPPSSVATKLWRSSKLRRFLSEDPSSSSSSVHFQMPKNLRSFEDFRPKVTKIFLENFTILCTKLSEKVKKYVLFLNFWTSIFPTLCWVLLLRKFVQVADWKKILTTKIFHFPLKIFVSSKIFEEFAIFEDLRRIFELTKILHIRLRSIFRNRRIFVFVFGPFSIFVATLMQTHFQLLLIIPRQFHIVTQLVDIWFSFRVWNLTYMTTNILWH